MDDSTTIIYKYDFFIRFLMKRKEEEEEKNGAALKIKSWIAMSINHRKGTFI